MYFSRLKFKGSLDEISEFYHNGYLVHQGIWSLFPDIPKEAHRPFLYRIDINRQSNLIYIFSIKKPVTQSLSWQIDTKEFNPQLVAGDRLMFSLRVNPVVTQRKEVNGCLKNVRHDVVMNEKNKFPKDKRNSENKYNINHIIAEKGFEWLMNRSERNGFSVDREQVRIHSYSPQLIRKRGKKEDINISTLDFDGILTVTDSELFIEKALKIGIGPAKGFGCGLMLIKRA